MIDARPSSESCVRRCSSSGFCSSACSSASRIRCFISEAAAFVNVATSRRSTLNPREGSAILRMMRSTSTAVFPDPAAAATRMSSPLCEMALHWSSLQKLPSGLGMLCNFVMSSPLPCDGITGPTFAVCPVWAAACIRCLRYFRQTGRPACTGKTCRPPPAGCGKARWPHRPR